MPIHHARRIFRHFCKVIARIIRGRDPLSITLVDQREKEDALLISVGYAYGARVAGDIIEFGTMSGETARILAGSMRSCEREQGLPSKDLYLFDSFEGLPASVADADREAPHVKSGIWAAGTCKILDREALAKLCGKILPAERIHIFAGWFSQTVPSIDPALRFSVLHVDCDLYQSTLDALRPLFQRNQVSRGAVFLFDDWNCNAADPRFGERKAWADLTEEFCIESSDEGGYAWSGRRFIVHEYRASGAAPDPGPLKPVD
jgi:O-methyltransferase